MTSAIAAEAGTRAVKSEKTNRFTSPPGISMHNYSSCTSARLFKSSIGPAASILRERKAESQPAPCEDSLKSSAKTQPLQTQRRVEGLDIQTIKEAVAINVAGAERAAGKQAC